MWTISSIKDNARDKFKANYGNSVLAIFLAGIITFGISSVSSLIPLGGLVSTIFLVNIISGIGLPRFFVHNHRDRGEIGHLFESFSSSYMNQVVVMLLKNLFVGLWSLLLVIPGIIKYYEYLMVPYILADNPDTSWDDAKEQSRAMMDGEKMNAFLLHLSFIGWALLIPFTLGFIYPLYLGPYIAQAEAELYHVLLEKTYAPAGSQSGPYSSYGQPYPGGYQAVNTNAPYPGGFNTQPGSFNSPVTQPSAPPAASAPASSARDTYAPNPWSVGPAAGNSSPSGSNEGRPDPFASVPELQTPDPFAASRSSGSGDQTADPFAPSKPASFGDLTADASDPLSVSGSSSAGGADSPVDSGSQPGAPDFNFSNFDDTDYTVSFFDD